MNGKNKKINNRSLNFAVIVPTYNGRDKLIDALESIRTQTLKPFEVHVVDDCSPTFDSNVVLQYIVEKQLRNWHVHRLDKNVGAGGARDFAIKITNAEYIAFLDADDHWLSDHLERSADIIRSYDLSLFGGKVRKTSGNSKNSMATVPASIQIINLNRMLLKCYFLTSTVIIKRSAYIDAGGFLKGKRLSEDYSLWLRVVASKENKCAVSNQIHAIYCDSESVSAPRLSSRHLKHEIEELKNYLYLYECDNINFIQLVISFLFSLVKYLKRLVAGLVKM